LSILWDEVGVFCENVNERGIIIKTICGGKPIMASILAYMLMMSHARVDFALGKKTPRGFEINFSALWQVTHY
jgi:hypothetical protein